MERRAGINPYLVRGQKHQASLASNLEQKVKLVAPRIQLAELSLSSIYFAT